MVRRRRPVLAGAPTDHASCSFDRSSGCSTSSTNSRTRSGTKAGHGTCTGRHFMAALITSCRTSCAGLRPISACTTSTTSAVEFRITGCPMCCAKILNLLLSAASLLSKAFAACVSCFGTKVAGVSSLSERWDVVTPVVARSVKTWAHERWGLHLLFGGGSDPMTTDMSVITESKKCKCAKTHFDVEHFHAKRDHRRWAAKLCRRSWSDAIPPPPLSL